MHGNNFCPRLRVEWRWIGNQANPASRLADGRLASEPQLVIGTVGAEENPSLIPVFRHSVQVFRVLLLACLSDLFMTDLICSPKESQHPRGKLRDSGPNRRPVRRRSTLECRSQRCLDGNRLDFLAEH